MTDPVEICQSKTPYPTIAKAHGAVRGRMRDRNPPTYLRVYRCEVCGMFHLTHKLPGKVNPDVFAASSVDDPGTGPNRLLTSPGAGPVHRPQG